MKIKVAITRQENADFYNKQIGDVIEVEFEEYVAAVVASEIGNSPIEACKAQAVAARSFAMSRGVLRGEIISDSSAVAQAYRAKRYNSKFYPNSLQGAQETAGEILFYEFKPVVAIYTASNGGETLSAAKRWHGGGYPYLITQKDPWDAAVGNPRKGHGVGMSQVGACYAAKQGYDYKQILAFYYPNTHIGQNYEDQEAVDMAIGTVETITSTLKKSVSGAQVVLLQTILNSLGYNCGTPDGNFGKQTEAAVKAFQKQYGLTQDGIVGPKTAEKLMELYKPVTTPVPTKDNIEIIRTELLSLQSSVNALKAKIDALLK